MHLRYPFYGTRQLRDALLDEHGLVVNRKRVPRLMLLMDIHAIYPGKKGLASRAKNIIFTRTCSETLESITLIRYDVPAIFNTDLGVQFTSRAYTGVLKQHYIRISMDAKADGLIMFLLNGYGVV